ncbi:UDP-N-acetylmuramate--L-alanine ligase [Lachnoclostridium sp. Marseille-P6806]|uniref:UDP-N-acetylmuramate--L-alanine ligase n=1 Tax=Lachnoclostridium sp. Marseille-P6806 TaxID=2364793 RepID=UPI00102F9869|nr:UDP-N-acetylmuramate--L-alanine ligase [Lachnoclostridium sp. Marseille-P6806]
MYQIDFQKPVHVYFVGIGGISMSGLAEILHSRGFRVSGSDRQASPLTRRLEGLGMRIFYGQREENITPDIDLAVFTAAIHPDNPEFAAVRRMNIPSLTRAELLGELMRNYDCPVAVAGTHGKTTTTSMLSEILVVADADPTLSIGGMLRSVGGNVRVGRSELFVAEACEYTNSFLSLFPKIGIILNIDADHLDFFHDLDDIRRSFRRFAELLPTDGCLIVNRGIERLEELTDRLTCRVITCGDSEDCDYRAVDIAPDGSGLFSYTLQSRDPRTGETFVSRVRLRVPGEHNVHNSMAALAAADLCGAPRSASLAALAAFEGTERRFEHKGSFDGVTVIDDYAHHPTEIRATLHAAQAYPHRKLWCVFQPHTYTRTKALLHEFAEALTLADELVIADIYAARETDTLGVSAQVLRDEIAALGRRCHYVGDFDAIEKFLRANCHNGDLLITMGAGNVNEIGEKLLQRPVFTMLSTVSTAPVCE